MEISFITAWAGARMHHWCIILFCRIYVISSVLNINLIANSYIYLYLNIDSNSSTPLDLNNVCVMNKLATTWSISIKSLVTFDVYVSTRKVKKKVEMEEAHNDP